MEQYIKKSALVAEIEKRRINWSYGSSIEAKYKREECDDILSFLDTLEVKEVDLEKELNNFIDKACEWLKENYPYYFETDIEEQFKKAMEE